MFLRKVACKNIQIEGDLKELSEFPEKSLVLDKLLASENKNLLLDNRSDSAQIDFEGCTIF